MYTLCIVDAVMKGSLGFFFSVCVYVFLHRMCENNFLFEPWCSGKFVLFGRRGQLKTALLCSMAFLVFIYTGENPCAAMHEAKWNEVMCDRVSVTEPSDRRPLARIHHRAHNNPCLGSRVEVGIFEYYNMLTFSGCTPVRQYQERHTTLNIHFPYWMRSPRFPPPQDSPTVDADSSSSSQIQLSINH